MACKVWVGFWIVPEDKGKANEFVGVFHRVGDAKAAVEKMIKDEGGDPGALEWGFDDVHEVWVLYDDELFHGSVIEREVE